jgi:hypothetical protein
MSNSKTERIVALLVKALDDVPVTDEEARDAARRLDIGTEAWAANIRERVTAANEADRKTRFDEARQGYVSEVAQLSAGKAESARSLAAQRAVLSGLLARAPRDMATSFHAHNVAESSEEEVAEMIKSLRDLLEGDDDP